MEEGGHGDLGVGYGVWGDGFLKGSWMLLYRELNLKKLYARARLKAKKGTMSMGDSITFRKYIWTRYNSKEIVPRSESIALFASLSRKSNIPNKMETATGNLMSSSVMFQYIEPETSRSKGVCLTARAITPMISAGIAIFMRVDSLICASCSFLQDRKTPNTKLRLCSHLILLLLSKASKIKAIANNISKRIFCILYFVFCILYFVYNIENCIPPKEIANIPIRRFQKGNIKKVIQAKGVLTV